MYQIKRPGLYLLIMAALFIHLGAMRYLRIGTTQPDMLLAAVVFAGFFTGAGRGLEAGFIAGLLQDIFSTGLFGFHALLMGLTGLMAGVLSTKFLRESKTIQALLVFLLSLFSMTLQYGLGSLLSNNCLISFSDYAASSVLPISLYTSIVSLGVFSMLMRIFKLRRPDDLW